MIMRITTVAAGLLAFGGSMSAVNAADAVSVPAPVFHQAFADLGAPAAVVVQPDAVDLATIVPAAEALRDIPDGVASWYGAELAGHRTANGEYFNPAELTAAHRTLPLGSRVKVTYRGRSVVVRINDRGPYAAGRVIDLSQAAAERIGLRRAGSGSVELASLIG
ncbi:MAG: septal ring lytic transglycosylase RlpA family protein [Croceibacterium sp.]